jgi:hypothetical protein
MTETVNKLVVNCADGSSQYIPLNAEEMAQLEADRLAWETKEAERVAAEAEQEVLKESANAKLAALGLTADEIAALKS